MIAILIHKILSLAVIMAIGWAMVKFRVLKPEDSRVLSTLSLYLIMPCMILSSFQVDYTDQIIKGLLLAFLAAAIIEVILILFGTMLGKSMHLNPVEQSSVIYSNAGNLIVPLVTAILGRDWVIYTSGLLFVQLVLLFTHGKQLLCRDSGFQLKKLLLNPNILAIGLGIFLFLTRIRLPGLLGDSVDSVGSTVGPVAMLVTGMLIGNTDLKKIRSYRRIWLIAFLRLIAAPTLSLLFLKFSGITRLVPDGKQILLVTFLAVTTPAASTVTQFAQVYGEDAEYASAINVVTTLLCIFTIPLMVMLYQL